MTTDFPPGDLVAAERARAAAVIARDLDALAACLHDDLVYVHATGARHDKAGLLGFVAQGPSFVAIDFEADAPTPLGEAALLHGRLHLQLRRAGETETVHARSWASALWLRGPGARWQLRLFQSTREGA